MTYNEIMRKAGKRLHPKVYYFDDENNKVEYEYEDIIQAKPFFNAKLLGTVMKGFSCTLKAKLPNKPIYFSNTAKYETSATKTYGPYFLKDVNYNADSKEYEYELYDDFIKTMVDYKPITITYPCTILDFFKSLCIECGFTTDITFLPNGNKTLTKDIYDGIGFTYRSVFDDIGQATASLFEIHNNKVKRCSFGTETKIINDDILKNQNIELGEHFGPVNSIILKRSGDADGIYKRDETASSWCELIIKDNQLMNDNNRSEFLTELYNELHNIEFDIFDLELVGYGGFNVLDKVQIETGGITYNSYVFNNELVFTDDFEEVIYSETPEVSESDYKVMNTTDKTIEQCWIIANKQAKEIEALVGRTTDAEEDITSLKLDMDSITEQVSHFDNQSQTIAQIRLSLDEINQQISAISDTTVSDKNTNKITLEDVNESNLIYLNIYPTATDISYLYLTSNLDLTDDLYLLSRKIVFKNITNNTVSYFELPCDLLYLNNDCYDEFIYDYNTETCYKVKRVGINSNGNKYALTESVNEYYTFPEILLSDGDYEISLLSFNDAMIQARAMVKNLYSAQYVTQTQFNARISQTKNEINASVSEKTTMLNNSIEELSGELNLQAEEVALKLNASNFTSSAVIGLINNRDGTSTAKIAATNINLDGYVTINSLSGVGTTTIDGSNIKTGTISANRLDASVLTTDNLSAQTISADRISAGTLTTSAINLGNGTFTASTAGAVKCSNITATGGSVGGFTIGDGLSNSYFSITKAGQLNLYPHVGSGATYRFNNGVRLNATSGIQITSNGGSPSFNSTNIDIVGLNGASVYVACRRGDSGSERSAVTCADGTLYLSSIGTIKANGSTIGGSSSRATKKNIKLLTDNKKQELYQLIKNIPLKEYDYKKQYGNKFNYGFLIEDIENTKLNDLLHIVQNKNDKNMKVYCSEDLTRLELVVIQELMKKIENLELEVKQWKSQQI